MARFSFSILFAAVLLLVAVAGCLEASPPDAAPPALPAPAPVGDEQGNLWLLDGPRPVTNTRISSGAEPSMLADRQGQFLWIADTTGAYVSEDNGTTWQGMPNFLLPSVFVDGWALAQDEENRLYAAALTGPEIDVGVSTNGKTWAYTTRVAAVSGTTDRPWLAATGDGIVSMIYFDAPLVATGFYEACARSTDAGRTWLDTQRIGAQPQAGNLVYTDDGAFHYAEDRGTVYSYNQGTCLGGASSKPPAFSMGANNMIQIAAVNNTLYGAAATEGNSAISVWSYFSNGQPKVVKVSPPNLKSNTFATISEHDGEIAVAWYGSETAGDPSNPSFGGSFNVYVAKLTDFWGEAGGPFVEHIRITDEPNHVGDICMGGIGCGNDADRDLLDYFMLDHDLWGGIHVAYVHDGSGSNPEVRYAHVPPGDQIQTVVGGPGAPVLQLRHQVSKLQLWASAEGTMDLEGDEFFVQWSMGDGTLLTGDVARHTYQSTGRYTVNVTATDVTGAQSSGSFEIIVDGFTENLAPIAKMLPVQSTATTGQTIAFIDDSTDSDGPIAAWNWQFGDGAEADGQEVSHAYLNPGTYTIALQVTDVWGATDTTSSQITISGPAVEPQEEDTPPVALALLAIVLLVAAAATRDRRAAG